MVTKCYKGTRFWFTVLNLVLTWWCHNTQGGDPPLPAIDFIVKYFECLVPYIVEVKPQVKLLLCICAFHHAYIQSFPLLKTSFFYYYYYWKVCDLFLNLKPIIFMNVCCSALKRFILKSRMIYGTLTRPLILLLFLPLKYSVYPKRSFHGCCLVCFPSFPSVYLGQTQTVIRKPGVTLDTCGFMW